MARPRTPSRQKTQAEALQFLSNLSPQEAAQYKYLEDFVAGLVAADVRTYATDSDGTVMVHTTLEQDIQYEYFENNYRSGDPAQFVPGGGIYGARMTAAAKANPLTAPTIKNHWFFNHRETEILFNLLRANDIYIAVVSIQGQQALKDTYEQAGLLDLIDEVDGVEQVNNKDPLFPNPGSGKDGIIAQIQQRVGGKVFYPEDKGNNREKVQKKLGNNVICGEIIEYETQVNLAKEEIETNSAAFAARNTFKTPEEEEEAKAKFESEKWKERRFDLKKGMGFTGPTITSHTEVLARQAIRDNSTMPRPLTNVITRAARRPTASASPNPYQNEAYPRVLADTNPYLNTEEERTVRVSPSNQMASYGNVASVSPSAKGYKPPLPLPRDRESSPVQFGEKVRPYQNLGGTSPVLKFQNPQYANLTEESTDYPDLPGAAAAGRESPTLRHTPPIYGNDPTVSTDYEEAVDPMTTALYSVPNRKRLLPKEQALLTAFKASGIPQELDAKKFFSDTTYKLSILKALNDESQKLAGVTVDALKATPSQELQEAEADVAIKRLMEARSRSSLFNRSHEVHRNAVSAAQNGVFEKTKGMLALINNLEQNLSPSEQQNYLNRAKTNLYNSAATNVAKLNAYAYSTNPKRLENNRAFVENALKNFAQVKDLSLLGERGNKIAITDRSILQTRASQQAAWEGIPEHFKQDTQFALKIKELFPVQAERQNPAASRQAAAASASADSVAVIPRQRAQSDVLPALPRRLGQISAPNSDPNMSRRPLPAPPAWADSRHSTPGTSPTPTAARSGSGRDLPRSSSAETHIARATTSRTPTTGAQRPL